MSSQKLKLLAKTLYITQKQQQKQRQHSRQNSFKKRKVHSLRQSARQNYIQLTDRSRQQQKSFVKEIKTARTPQWKYDHKKINDNFSIFPPQIMDPFPHNNVKYNIQFLQKNLHGKDFKHPIRDLGYFQNPSDILYSQHYRPIVHNKRKFNETYQLRTSLFTDTWVDIKRDHIMDEYKLQANPFRTPVSNTLISTMHKQRNRRHRF